MDNGRVTAVSDTIQEFGGERFYLCGWYFQHKGKRLHRAVWEAHNGEIPEGYHVHHVDGDRANNQLDNLVLLAGLEHTRTHAREESRRENGRRAIKMAVLAAPEWHRSEAGSAWHSAHARAYWASVEPKEYICEFCGGTFMSRNAGGARFCGQNCKAKARRRAVRNES